MLWGTQVLFRLLALNACRSVEIALGEKAIGNVTIPPNHTIPVVGQVVEIRYLYVTGVGGSLYQPVYLGERDDVRDEECTVERQRIKFRSVEDLYAAFAESKEPTDLTVSMVLSDLVPLSKLMAEQITALRTWAKGRARLATSAEEARKGRKIAA